MFAFDPKFLPDWPTWLVLTIFYAGCWQLGIWFGRFLGWVVSKDGPIRMG